MPELKNNTYTEEADKITLKDDNLLIVALGGDSPCAEFTHVIIDKKNRGYGHEALKLLLKWTFEFKNYHRVWIDCKDYNSIALHLYESLGFVREGLLREYLLTNGVYENLVVLGMLDREYERKWRHAGT